MSQPADFAALMERLRHGDQSVAWEVFQRFGGRLVGLARTRLDSRVRGKVDPEDVVQSALHSFFHRQAGGQFDLESWDSLWSLLTVMTLRKCGRKIEHFLAACRDVRREAKSLAEDEDSARSFQAIAREPTPEEATRLTETIEQLFQGLTERDRQVLELSLQGYKPPEISTRLGRTERSVYRLLERCKRRLAEMADEGREQKSE